MFKFGAVILAILILLVSPFVIAMGSNQLKLIQFASQFDDFESRFSLNELVVEKSHKIVHDWGSGNYCIYIIEKTYDYVPTQQEKIEMSLFVFNAVDIRADGANAKVLISQKGAKLRIYVEDGPRDNVFDLRCG